MSVKFSFSKFRCDYVHWQQIVEFLYSGDFFHAQYDKKHILYLLHSFGIDENFKDFV